MSPAWPWLLALQQLASEIWRGKKLSAGCLFLENPELTLCLSETWLEFCKVYNDSKKGSISQLDFLKSDVALLLMAAPHLFSPLSVPVVTGHQAGPGWNMTKMMYVAKAANADSWGRFPFLRAENLCICCVKYYICYNNFHNRRVQTKIT